MGQAWEPGSGFLLAAQSNGLPRMLWLWCRGMLSFELRATCCDNEPGSTRAHSASQAEILAASRSCFAATFAFIGCSALTKVSSCAFSGISPR